MKQKKEQITDVVFRKETTKEFEGEIFALFPHEAADFSGNVTCYQHVGQHSSADYKGCIRSSVIATEDEYADLKKELENIGYTLRVVQRQNPKKFLASYQELNNPRKRRK